MRAVMVGLVVLFGVPFAHSDAQQRRVVARTTPVIVHNDSSVARTDAPMAAMAMAVPGAVTTLSIDIPRPLNAQGRSATYVLTHAEGVRLFGDTVGMLTGIGDLSLPITFSVSPARDAG